MQQREATEEYALLMISRVERDTTLPAPVRTAARSLSLLLDDGPPLAVRRLKRIAEQVLPNLPRHPPDRALVRAVELPTYYRYHMDPRFQAFFRTVEDYRRFLDNDPAPAERLRQHLRPDPVLVPWRWSWLAPLDGLQGLSGRDISRALETGHEPPLVLFLFDHPQAALAGLEVREPCSLDSVLGDHEQWRPEGPVSGVGEFLDGDVPLAALTEILWRP